MHMDTKCASHRHRDKAKQRKIKSLKDNNIIIPKKKNIGQYNSKR